jgi:hypothetical protein
MSNLIKDKLEAKLARIGWSLRHCGCNVFRVHNNLGEATLFEYYGESLRSRGRQIFGEELSDAGDAGLVVFGLADCDYEYDSRLGCLSILCGGAYVTFHSFRAQNSEALAVSQEGQNTVSEGGQYAEELESLSHIVGCLKSALTLIEVDEPALAQEALGEAKKRIAAFNTGHRQP